MSLVSGARILTNSPILNSCLMSSSDSNRLVKKAKLRAAVADLNRKVGEYQFDQYAHAMIDPTSTGPLVFPSPVPGRAGAAVFPVVFDVNQANWGLVISPSLTNPVTVTHSTAIAESANEYAFHGITDLAGVSSSMRGDTGCTVIGSRVAGQVSLPYASAAGVTVSWGFSYESGALDTAVFALDALVSGVWTQLVSGTFLRGETRAIAPVVYPSTATDFTVRCSSVGGTSVHNFSTRYSSTLKPTAGTGTCAPVVTEQVMDIIVPSWAQLLDSSDEIRIVAMDCLVTYMGSSLSNGGTIAACNANADMEIINDDFYTTINRRPFDKYEGRLASEGQSQGGAHWHYVPDDPASLRLATTGFESPNTMAGFFGISGQDATQPVRVMVNIMVNFFSLDPSYHMEFQPPMLQSGVSYSQMIHHLRKDVPLVTSNDLHDLIKKAKKFAKEGIIYARDNPEKVAQAIAMIASYL
nr:hypothetical protein [Mute swan feces associated noda-like virus 3]